MCVSFLVHHFLSVVSSDIQLFWSPACIVTDTGRFVLFYCTSRTFRSSRSAVIPCRVDLGVWLQVSPSTGGCVVAQCPAHSCRVLGVSCQTGGLHTCHPSNHTHPPPSLLPPTDPPPISSGCCLADPLPEQASTGVPLGRGQVVLFGFCLAEVWSLSVGSAWPNSDDVGGFSSFLWVVCGVFWVSRGGGVPTCSEVLLPSFFAMLAIHGVMLYPQIVCDRRSSLDCVFLGTKLARKSVKLSS